MKRALVTGANRGIGLAIARGLADAGHTVLVGARDLRAGQKAADRIGGIPLQLDVSDSQSIEAAAETAGPVDILINNAGVLGSGGVLKDPQDFEDSMQVMVHGPYHLMHKLSKDLLDGLDQTCK